VCASDRRSPDSSNQSPILEIDPDNKIVAVNAERDLVYFPGVNTLVKPPGCHRSEPDRSSRGPGPNGLAAANRDQAVGSRVADLAAVRQDRNRQMSG
jgi:hypothetical protein